MTTDNSNRDDCGEKKTRFEQLDLFPLHPELMMEEEEEKVEEDAGDDTPSSSFFYPDLGAAVTLTSLFGETDVNATSAVKEKEEEERLNSGDGRRGGRGMLCLKLDYENILNAWSEKGSLYVRDDDYESQIVPQLHPFSEHTCWTAPENGGGGDTVELSYRKERVMRYKEKRRLRLFSKRIRYQVRKLNAEKRPRIKGRFVKRIDRV